MLTALSGALHRAESAFSAARYSVAVVLSSYCSRNDLLVLDANAPAVVTPHDQSQAAAINLGAGDQPSAAHICKRHVLVNANTRFPSVGLMEIVIAGTYVDAVTVDVP